jgi:outer membrane receptor protein involved in Fe transport
MFKKSLLAIGVFGLVGTAFAADITNPFYLPNKGQVASTTSGEFNLVQYKNGNENVKLYNTILQQQLQLGITDKLSLWGYFGNTFDKTKYISESISFSGKQDENLNWGAGLTWNIWDKNLKLQASLGYNQDKLYNSDGEFKYLSGQIKVGYQLKTMLPYVEIGEELPVAQPKDNAIDKPVYTGKIGLYQGELESWGLDTGLRTIHDENESEATFYNIEAEASYYLTKSSAVGIYGSYTLNGKAKNQTDIYDKSIGLRLKWTF